eukprot:TRINITY_DN16700_c0_g1_i1.p1 TRINITY_DN16700_c0_g1~~TRINITY_DN16700_c0_g1_i1.p1  ORF type:complete len:742 (-),score=286.06 TRINITY_DN16700_c0_g1_i1:415-2640(-)
MTTSTSAFLTSLFTNIVIFAVLFVVFLVLVKRASLAVIFYSKRILLGSGPPDPKSVGPFTWLTDAIKASDTELAERAGLDALVYITLSKTAIQIFGVSMLYCIIIELPVNVTGGYYEDFNSTPEVVADPNKQIQFTGFDKMSMGNISKKSARLWCHAFACYFVAFTTYYFLWANYKKMSDLRALFLGGVTRAAPRQYAVLVTDIPNADAKTRHSQVDSFFRKLHPGTYESATVISKYAKVEKVYQEKEKIRKKLAHSEAVYAEAQKKDVEKAKRPQHKVGFLGLLGNKVDTIDWCRDQLAALESKLADEQAATTTDRTINSAMVYFNSRAVATMAAQSVHAKKAETWQTQVAPEPREVIWANLGIPWWERFVRQSAVYGITFLIVFFFMIPITIVSGFSTLDNLKKFAPFLKSVFNISAISAILQAFLPQLALIIFLAILPSLLLFLTKKEGIASIAHANRGTAGKYYYFMVFNVFLGVTVAGSALGQLKQMTKNPSGIIDLLGSSIPQQATFFITFIMLKTFIGNALGLSQVVRALIYLVKLKFLVKTEEEKLAAWAPGQFNYGSLVPNDLLIVILGMCYAVIAPIILPFCIAYFGLSYVVKKNLALEVMVPDYESGGRMYPHIHKRFLASLFVSQITLLGYFGIMQFAATPVLIPLPILTAVFHLYTKKSLETRFSSTAIEVALQDVKEEPSVAEVTAAYTPEYMVNESVETDIEAPPSKGPEIYQDSEPLRSNSVKSA